MIVCSVDIQGLRAVCSSPEQRLLVHHVIFTETMTTIINIVQKLDLSAAQPNQDNVSFVCCVCACVHMWIDGYMWCLCIPRF